MNKGLPSVTTILKAYPKQDVLIGWAAKVVAEAAEYDELWRGFQSATERVNYLKGAPRRINKKATDHGTWVHKLLQSIAEGKEPEGGEVIEVAILRDAIARYRMNIWFSEYAVLNYQYQYGGSFDLIAEIGDKLYLVDLKSSLDVYPDYRLQQAAYRYASVIVKKDDLMEREHVYDVDAPVVSAMPIIDGVAILHMPRETPDEWGLYEIKADREDFEAFLGVKLVWEWMQATKKQPEPQEVPAPREAAA